MLQSLSTFFPVYPELFLLAATCLILLVGLFLPKSDRVVYALAQVSLMVVVALSWQVFKDAGMEGEILLFHSSYVLDGLSTVLKSSIALFVFVTFLFSYSYNQDRGVPSCEFYVLGLLSTLGMMVLVSAHSLLTLYLGIELLALPTYALVALQRNEARCIEAAMKYFVMGALASGLLLYGFSLLFGATSHLDIGKIALAITAMPDQYSLIVVFALVFIVAGFSFKLGLAPFHMWVPDVYDGAPSSVTLFISAAPKLAAVGLMIRLLEQAMPGMQVHWQHMMIVVAVLSMAIGNLAAIMQTSFKRMLAYSSIAHMGYLSLGMLCATPGGDAAALLYALTYGLMTLGAFGMIVLMSKAGFEADQIKDFSGLGSRSPWMAFMLLLIMFSMAGIPPLVGFIAKMSVFEALIQVHLVWLAVVAVIFAIIGAYYYIRVVQVMYFEEAAYSVPIQIICTRNWRLKLFRSEGLTSTEK